MNTLLTLLLLATSALAAEPTFAKARLAAINAAGSEDYAEAAVLAERLCRREGKSRDECAFELVRLDAVDRDVREATSKSAEPVEPVASAIPASRVTPAQTPRATPAVTRPTLVFQADEQPVARVSATAPTATVYSDRSVGAAVRTVSRPAYDQVTGLEYVVSGAEPPSDPNWRGSRVLMTMGRYPSVTHVCLMKGAIPLQTGGPERLVSLFKEPGTPAFPCEILPVTDGSFIHVPDRTQVVLLHYDGLRQAFVKEAQHTCYHKGDERIDSSSLGLCPKNN